MIDNKKIVVVLPAYNAERTLEKTYKEIPFDIVDDVILVDDQSSDKTVHVGKELGIQHIIKHEKNKGYGGNQKSCYNKALELDADIVVHLARSRFDKIFTLEAIGMQTQFLGFVSQKKTVQG